MQLRTVFYAIAAVMSGVSWLSYAQDNALLPIQQTWQKCKYELHDKSEQVTCFNQVIADNQKAVDINKGNTDLITWLAINKASLAYVIKGLDGLSLAKEAKHLLESVISDSVEASNISALVTLGSLYAAVPGWPVSYGSSKQAEKLFKKAIRLAPKDMDSNYFYGEFLIEQNRGDEARTYLLRAQEAPAYQDRPLVDKERQKKILEMLKSLD